MTAFPLDDTYYLAQDIRLFFAGRVPGIMNVTGTDFQVSASGGMNVSVKNGVAYTKVSTAEFGGLIYCPEQQTSFTVDLASNETRYDYIAIRTKSAENTCQLVYQKGDSNLPTPIRTASEYELILAIITVSGNAGELTNDNIQDTRMNSTYCGLTVDTLTKIPTDQYDLYFHSFMDKLKDVLDENTAGNLLNLINENKESVELLRSDVQSLMDNDFLYKVGTTEPDTDSCPQGYFYFQIEE